MIPRQYAHVRAGVLRNASTSFGTHHMGEVHGVEFPHLSEQGWQSCSPAASSDLIDTC